MAITIKNWITFGSVDCRTYKVYISGNGTFNSPERDGTNVSIPGRNGDIFLDNERYKNIDVKYPAFIAESFSTNMQNFRNAILSKVGYQRLEDTYHPDEFRLAKYKGGLDVKPLKSLKAGEFNITFNCKPQRFLKSGETGVDFTTNGTISNATLMTAKPLIRVVGNGTLTIGTVAIVIANNSTYIDIDCETMEAYCGSTNMNSNITLTGGKFPELVPGFNSVSIGTLTKATITPRWWIL